MDTVALEVVVGVLGVGVGVWGSTWIKKEIATLKTTVAKVEADAKADIKEVKGWFTHTASPVVTPAGAVAVDTTGPVLAKTVVAPTATIALVPVDGESLDPTDAVKQYVVSKALPSLYNINWLLSLNAPARFAWGKAVADAFDVLLPAAVAPVNLTPGTVFTALTETVGDIGTAPDQKIRPEAATYLIAVSQGFKYAGTWVFTRS